MYKAATHIDVDRLPDKMEMKIKTEMPHTYTDSKINMYTSTLRMMA